LRGDKGLTLEQLCTALHLDPLRLEPVLRSLVGLDWIGQLSESVEPGNDARYVLLADPQNTPVAPLLRVWLVAEAPATEKLWNIGRWPSVTLREVL